MNVSLIIANVLQYETVEFSERVRIHRWKSWIEKQTPANH